jgi:hypothetical protein
MKKFKIIPKKINYAMLLFAASLLAAFSSCKKSDKVEKEEKTGAISSKAKGTAASTGLSFTVVSNTMISSRGNWNGLTDLQGYKGKLYCVYREGTDHLTKDGKIRVLRYNATTFKWEGIKLLTYNSHHPDTIGDLRDPHLSIRPSDGKMMMTVAVHIYKGGTDVGIQSMAYFSDDMVNWGEPFRLGAPGKGGWLWRTEWYNGIAYNFKYQGAIMLMKSTTGESFTTQLGPDYYPGGGYFANETGLVFNPGAGGNMVALMRLDGTADQSAKVGFSSPPYDTVSWYNSGIRIGGPNLFRMENGAIIAGIRRVIGDTRYPAIYLVHSANRGQMTELVRLVPGDAGDCGYLGFWKYGSQLWVSYYSSHEADGRSRIYLAKLNYTL